MPVPVTVTVPEVDPTGEDWGAWSPDGVLPPPAGAGLPPAEASSPARRSPQVRAAQAAGTRRPDRLGRVRADHP